MASDREQISTEDNSGSKKGRTLLQVPSRSSSQKNQSPATSNGLSGATVSESRTSIGGRSKDSKGSLMGRQRNGSASSNRTGGNADTNNQRNSQPSSPSTSTQKRKKSGGFLSFLGCCGVPEDANPVEGEEENVHKIEKIPQRQTTSKAKTNITQEQPVINEKTAPVTNETFEKTTGSEENTTTEIEEAQPSKSTATQEEQESTHENSAQEEDVDMKDVSQDQQDEALVPDDAQTRNIPPPPPGPGPAGNQGQTAMAEAITVSEPRKWLLPPILPEHKGRKCLVLDLDETLVHSSFKVCILFPFA